MIRVEKLGIVDYEQALARMRAHVHHRAHGHRDTPDELWLTEHPPVFTLGFASRPEHLHATGAIPVVETERGGQVTYHGPGQVIAYLLLDLRRRKIGVRELVCRIETGIIACLAGHGIEGLRKPGAPGIYVRPRTALPPDAPSPGALSPGASPPDIPPEPAIAKIASIGLKVSHGLTWHGVALNGAMDLEPFDRIDPCGYAGLRMTDVAKEAGTHTHDLGRRLPDDLARALVEAIEG
jgi:lipoyl(octanoyl) transferase